MRGRTFRDYKIFMGVTIRKNRIVDSCSNYPEMLDSPEFMNVSVVRKFRITENDDKLAVIK